MDSHASVEQRSGLRMLHKLLCDSHEIGKLYKFHIFLAYGLKVYLLYWCWWLNRSCTNMAVTAWMWTSGQGFHQSAGTRQSLYPAHQLSTFEGPSLLPCFWHTILPCMQLIWKKRFRFAWQQSNAGSSFLITKRKKLECGSQAHSAESRDGIQTSALPSYFPTIYVRRLSFSDSNRSFFPPKHNHYSPFC